MCEAHLATEEGAILCDIFLSPLRHPEERVSSAFLPSGYVLMGEVEKSCHHEKHI